MDLFPNTVLKKNNPLGSLGRYQSFFQLMVQNLKKLGWAVLCPLGLTQRRLVSSQTWRSGHGMVWQRLNSFSLCPHEKLQASLKNTRGMLHSSGSKLAITSTPWNINFHKACVCFCISVDLKMNRRKKNVNGDLILIFAEAEWSLPDGW